ncbi:MAG: DUF2163 domain-containing protein [Alphaproteobacteria bacterium]|nr:DUF2163 domain-containing protein [Alphaproteobacteria bacterium]
MASPLTQDELTHLALCWRLVRRDGVALGFTSHDRDLLVDGLIHLARPGMSPSAIVLGDGVTADDLEVAGGLSSAALTRADLLAGRWDAAQLRLFLVDWRDPAAGQVALASGTLGDVAVGEGGDAGFTATLDSPAAALQASVVELCSPTCRAELGDPRCRVSLRGRRRVTLVTAMQPGRFQAAAILAADHEDGRLLVLDGAAAGLERRLVAASDGWLHPDEPLALAVGDRVQLTEGCDKRFATCRDRFANAANFRGEPHVPGGDLLTRIGA